MGKRWQRHPGLTPRPSRYIDQHYGDATDAATAEIRPGSGKADNPPGTAFKSGARG